MLGVFLVITMPTIGMLCLAMALWPGVLVCVGLFILGCVLVGRELF